MSALKSKPQTVFDNLTSEFKNVVPARSIGYGDSLSPQDILRLTTDCGFQSVCNKQGPQYDLECQAAKKLASDTNNLFEFPISLCLTPSKLSKANERNFLVVEEKINASADKRVLLDNVVKVLESKNFSKTVISDVTSIIDELVTNSLYNAPFVSAKSLANPGLSRHDIDVVLDANLFVRVFVAVCDSRLVVGCQDPFGTLNLHGYLCKIKNTYDLGVNKAMNFGCGGAGIGSFLVFNTGSSFYFGVNSSRSTILCCTIPVGVSYRKRKDWPKHLHWLQL